MRIEGLERFVQREPLRRVQTSIYPKRHAPKVARIDAEPGAEQARAQLHPVAREPEVESPPPDSAAAIH